MTPRPLPVLDGLAGEFYERCARGELCFQRCDDCDTWRHPPRVRCAACGSERWAWKRSSGAGRVFSWTTVHQAMHPAFATEVPYAVLVVEMDEGVRLVSNLRDLAPDELRLALGVEVVFEDVGGGVTLPMFRPS